MSLRFTEAEFLILAGKSPQSKTQLVITNGYQSKVSGWLTLDDKKCYFKSLWEMNYARYLQFLKNKKDIHDWEYEPETFAFPKDDYKAGPFYYKPDFKVWFNKKRYEWHEVKGFLNPQSKKKIKRFEKHHPNEGPIVLIDKEWFRKLNKTYSTFIPGWETVEQAKRRIESHQATK